LARAEQTQSLARTFAAYLGLLGHLLVAQLPGVLHMEFVEANSFLMQLASVDHNRWVSSSSVRETLASPWSCHAPDRGAAVTPRIRLGLPSRGATRDQLRARRGTD